MNLTKTQKPIYTATFSDEEINTLKKVIAYTCHRLSLEHRDSGIDRITTVEEQALIRQWKGTLT